MSPKNARQRQAELKSVLDPQTKKRVGGYSGTPEFWTYYLQSSPEILIQRVKKMDPEEIARCIKQFD
jgi:cytokinesis protein